MYNLNNIDQFLLDCDIDTINNFIGSPKAIEHSKNYQNADKETLKFIHRLAEKIKEIERKGNKMSLLSWFKGLFKNSKKCCSKASEATYTTITRRGYDIIIPTNTYETLTSLKYTFNLTLYKKKPSSVQLFVTENGKQKYKGTLKDWLNVKSFKDGNVCNFKFENIIEKEETL